MTETTTYDDDYTGSFEYYQVSTNPNPYIGSALLFGTIVFSLSLYALLPFMVKCARKRQEAINAKRRAKRAVADFTEDELFDDIDHHNIDDNDRVSVQRDCVDEVEISLTPMQIVPPVPSPSNVRSYSHHHSNSNHNHKRSVSNTGGGDGWELRSMASASTAAPGSVWSTPTKFVHDVLENAHNVGRHGQLANRMHRRHIEQQAEDPESKEFTTAALLMQQRTRHLRRHRQHQRQQRHGGGSNFSDGGLDDRGGRGGHGGGGPRTVASYSPGTRREPTAHSSSLDAPPSPAHTFTPGMDQGYYYNGSGGSDIYPIPKRAGGGAAMAVSDLGSDIGSDAVYRDPYYHHSSSGGGNNNNNNNNYPKSVSSSSLMSGPQTGEHQQQQHQKDEEKALKKSGISKDTVDKDDDNNNNTWWDSLLQVVEWDHENGRLFKLAIPYTSQALMAGMAEAARVAVIGKLYGTRELSAYVIVHMFLGLTKDFFGGIIDAMSVLCIQSIGMGTTRLTGQYIQIGLVLYLAIVTPATMAFVVVMGDILAFLGFDEETVRIGVEFTNVYAWYLVLYGFDNSLNALLDITGHEIYSTVVTSLREILVTVVVLVAAIVAEPSLQDAGSLMLGILILVIFWNVGYIAGRGWWRKYYSGMLYTFALRNCEATKAILTTSIPLSFGYLLAYGEWELLTVFAKFLGPAEVATWGLLGTVWDVLEATTEAISEAGEVRCAYLLGAGRFIDARVSAFKSMFLAFFASLLLSAIVLMCGESLSVWMTNDPTLQQLMSQLIPLFAMGNVALTTGTTAWTLVGAQGRYSLSTAVGFAGSWCVTVPLAALSSVALNIDLRGQTAALVAGYMVSGTWNLFFLLISDWQGISERVIAYNAANDIELDSDQVSSSSSSVEEKEESSKKQPSIRAT